MVLDSSLDAYAGSATLNLNGYSETIRSLSSPGIESSVVTSSRSGAITLTIADGQGADFAGVIQNGSGTVSVVKAVPARRRSAA